MNTIRDPHHNTDRSDAGRNAVICIACLSIFPAIYLIGYSVMSLLG